MELKCPCCENTNNKKMLFQLHYTKRFHTFICAECRTEVDYCTMNNLKDINNRLKHMFFAVISFENEDAIDEIRKTIESRTVEENKNRLDYLDKKKSSK